MGLFTNDGESAGGTSQITIISEHLSVTGEINGTDNVYINGSFKGRIVTQGEVSIGPKGNVDAEIVTKTLLVSGHLEGSIVCEAMTIFPTGQVIGSLCSSTLKLHPGGYYFGESRLRTAQPAPATPADANMTVHLSVVATQPTPKETKGTSAKAATSAKKFDRSKSEQLARDKFNTVPAVKPVVGKVKKPRFSETTPPDQSTAPAPNETSEPRRWHRSWNR